MFGNAVRLKLVRCTDENRASLLENFESEPYDESRSLLYTRNQKKRLEDEKDIFDGIKGGSCKDSSVSFVYININNGDTVAYCAVNCTAVMTNKAAKRFFLRMGRTLIPAVEIKYFAVDYRYRHMCMSSIDKTTLSESILGLIVADIIEVAQTKIGASVIVLYAVPIAVHFYQKCGFETFGREMIRDEGEFAGDCTPLQMNISNLPIHE